MPSDYIGQKGMLITTVNINIAVFKALELLETLVKCNYHKCSESIHSRFNKVTIETISH